MPTYALEGTGAKLLISGAELSAPLISIGNRTEGRGTIETTHLRTEAAKTYEPTALPDRGSIEVVIDHDPQGLRLVLYPPGPIAILYPLQSGQTEPSRIDLYGFVERQGAEEMRTDGRAVTRLLLRLTDPAPHYNGYSLGTYQETWNGTAWGSRVFLGCSCSATLPDGVNTWSADGTTATGTFADAMGTGDYDCIVGGGPCALVPAALPNALPAPMFTIPLMSAIGPDLIGVYQIARNFDITPYLPPGAGAVEIDIQCTTTLSADPSPYAPHVDFSPNAQPAFGPTIPGAAGTTPTLPQPTPIGAPVNAFFAHNNPYGPVLGTPPFVDSFNLGRYPGNAGTMTLRFCKSDGQSVRLHHKMYNQNTAVALFTSRAVSTAIRFYPACTGVPRPIP